MAVDLHSAARCLHSWRAQGLARAAALTLRRSFSSYVGGGEWGEVDACVAGREVRGALRVKGWVGDGKLSLAVGGCERSPVK